MTEIIFPAVCAAFSAIVSLVGYELGLRRQRIESRMLSEAFDRIEHLESDSRWQIQQIGHLQVRVEGMPQLGPYRATTSALPPVKP